MGTELRFGGHRNSTLHTRLCNVENGNSLCISGYLTRAFRRNSGQNLRKKIDQQTFAESSSSAALKDVGENQISVQPVSPGLSKAVRRTLPTRVGLTHDTTQLSSGAGPAWAAECYRSPRLSPRLPRMYLAESCRPSVCPGTPPPRTSVQACRELCRLRSAMQARFIPEVN